MEVEIDTELLIRLIEERPCLWDRTLEEYKLKTVTIEAWNEVFRLLNPDFESLPVVEKREFGSAVMKRWKNTKDNFVRRIREMKEASNMRSQNGVRFKKKPRKYVFHDQLQFLYKLYDPSEYKYHFKKEKRSLVEEDIMADVDNSIVMFEESKSENETIEDKDEYILGIDTVDDALLDDTPQSTQLVPIGNKRSYDEVQLKLLNALEKMENTNPHISFVNSLLPTLNKLTPEQILDFQYGVLKLLKDITSSKSSERPSTSTSYF